MQRILSYFKKYGVAVITAGIILVPAVFVLAQAPQEAANVEAALTDLSAILGEDIETVEEAKAICNEEKHFDDCASVGKKHKLYDPEEEKQVDAVLNELKGAIKTELEACASDECLISVASRLAQRIASRNPSAARVLELTTAKVQEKKAVIDTAKEIGVNFNTCREMDPDSAPVDILRACARLAKDERVIKAIPEAARASVETKANLIEAKSSGLIAGCGDGTLEGCGAFCFDSERIKQGESAIPEACLVLARTVFKNEGGEEALRNAYREVADQVVRAEEYYAKRAQNIVFKTRDGRIISDPPEIGRYLEERGRSGDVEEVERGMDFMVSHGIIRTQDKEFALSFVKKIKEQGRIVDFDECASNPDACRAFIPEEHFDEFRQFEDAMRRNIGFDPEQCRRSQSNEGTNKKCVDGAKKAIQELRSQGIKSTNILEVIDNLEEQVEIGERLQSRKTEFDRAIRSEGGPGGCRTETECRTYCSDSAHGPECIAFGTKQGIFKSDEVVQRFTQFQTTLQSPQYVPGSSYTTQGAPFYGTGPYPGFIPPGQIPGFTQPGPGFSGQPIPVFSYINPDCLLAIQAGDFVKAKIACQFTQPTPPPIVGPVCPSLPTADPEECRRNGGEVYVTYSSKECGTYYGCRPVAIRQANTRVYLKPASNTQFDKYLVVAEDPEGISLISVTTVKGGNVYGGNPSCVPQITSSTVTLQGDDFPLRARVSDCSKPAQEFFGDVWPPAQPRVGYCGDKVCDANESYAICPSDCGGTITPYPSPTGGQPACSDGIDNDQDGQIDYPKDTGCYDAYDPTEYPYSGGGNCLGYSTQSLCSSAGCVWYQNHWDGTHCDDAAHGGGQVNYEGDAQGECSDGIDNDYDGLKDGADPGCGAQPTPSSCPSGVLNLLNNDPGCHWMYTDSSGKPIYCNGGMTQSAQQGDTAAKQGCIGPTYSPTPVAGCGNYNTPASCGSLGGCVWDTTQNLCKSPSCLGYTKATCEAEQGCKWSTTSGCGSAYYPSPTPTGSPTYSPSPSASPSGSPTPGTGPNSTNVGIQTYAGNSTSCPCWNNFCPSTTWYSQGTYCDGTFSGTRYCAPQTGTTHLNPSNYTTSSCQSGGGTGGGCGTYTTQSSCQSAGCSWAGTYCYSYGGPSGTCTQSEINLLGTGCHYMSGNTPFDGSMTKYASNGVVVQCSTTYIAGCSGGTGGNCSSYISQSSCTSSGCAWTSSGTCTTLSNVPENCSNGIDDDGDGWIDSTDPSCGGSGGGSSCSCPSGSYGVAGGGSSIPTYCVSSSNSTLCGTCGSSSVSTFSSSQCQTGGGSTNCSTHGSGWHVMSDPSICFDPNMQNYRTSNGTLYSCSSTPVSGCSTGGWSPTPWPSPTSSSCPSGYHSMGSYCMSDSNSTVCQPFGGGATYTCSSYSPTPSPSGGAAVCGNGYCESGETTGSCPSDCGSYSPTPTPTFSPPSTPTPTPAPTPPSCTAPAYFDPGTGSCVTPTPTATPPPPPTPTPIPSCTPPAYYDSATNSCVTPSPPPTSYLPFNTRHMIAELLTVLKSLANLLSSLGQ